ncbi:Transcription termination factor 3, mitochondrial [Anthophora quadrimaculata]
MFSRSCVILLARCRSGEAARLVLPTVSRNRRLFAASANEALKNETQRYASKECNLPRSVAFNDTNDSERLRSDQLAQNDVKTEDDSSVAKVCDELHKSSDVVVFEANKCQLNDALDDIEIKLPGPFDQCVEDLSHIGPNFEPTYNFAKYADKSKTIQELVKLGVELYKLEYNRDVMTMFLSLDFDKDMKPYIQFLNDCGVNPKDLGFFITRNPMIFKEDMDDLHTRIRYLRAHQFIPEMIQTIVNKHPPWLSFSTVELDRRLGYFQSNFKLNGYEVRCLSVSNPKLITYNMDSIKRSTFAVKEEMGFNYFETKNILMKAPRVWIRARTEVVKTFDYLHNHMGLSHKIICNQPQILVCRKSRVEKRHEYLVSLKRDQYDPTKPMYVSPLALVGGSDLQFCTNVAKTSITTYNKFLKSF